MKEQIKQHIEVLENIYEARRLANERLKVCIDHIKKCDTSILSLMLANKYLDIRNENEKFEELCDVAEVQALELILNEFTKEEAP